MHAIFCTTGRHSSGVRDLSGHIAEARRRPELFSDFRGRHARQFRGYAAPEAIIRCVEAAVELPIDEGLRAESEISLELQRNGQGAALRHVFFAERQIWKVPGITPQTPRKLLHRVSIVGAGTMGRSIALAIADAGYPVSLIERDAAVLERAAGAVAHHYGRERDNGRLAAVEAEARQARISTHGDLGAAHDADLVIEAVFEDIDLKQRLFRDLSRIVRDEAILATNTSRLDIDAIAGLASRPENVLGMHFFSPANMMRLVEIVRAGRTKTEVLASALDFVRALGKLAVTVKAGPGFVANRMLDVRQREANRVVLEGASPWDVDRVLYDFGFPMGPFAMRDLAGLDLTWGPGMAPARSVQDLLCEIGRRGQKVDAGFYDYDSSRRPSRSALVEALIRKHAEALGISQRPISDIEILERCLYPMINEGAKLLAEGIASCSSDIDIVWIYGFGFPKYRGGPMFYANTIGLGTVLETLRRYHDQGRGSDFAPAALLAQRVHDGQAL